MSISLSLKPRVLRSYDPDASSYISSVEIADNQALEQPIKEAITEFVVGCKIRGIWDSIKSCCLLCGARTLNGAVVPLKGNAPILTSFVGDYNRETGLKRTSGSFNINRNNNVDPQDNKHVAIYPTFIDYGSSDSNFRSLLTGTTGSGSTFFAVTSLGLNARVNTTSNIVTSQPVTAGNMIAVSILNSTQSQLLYNNNINTMNVTTTTPVATDLTLFGGGGVSTSLSRISYYSVGERLNLKLLQQTLDQFNNRIWQAFRYNMTDNNASSYVSKVETIDQSYLPNPVRLAIDNFVIGCKSDNIWSNINASCILCAARTLNGCLIPLVGPIPKNNRFSDADYNRTTGLVGNKSNKNIDTNFNNNTTAMNNIHIAVYVQKAQTTSGAYCGASTSPGNLQVIYQGNPPQARCRSNTLVNLPTGIFPLGLVGVSRSSSDSLIGRSSQTQLTITSASDAGSPGAGNFFIFDRGDISLPSDGRYQFYSIGTAINLELLENRLSTLMNSISSAL